MVLGEGEDEVGGELGGGVGHGVIVRCGGELVEEFERSEKGVQ